MRTSGARNKTKNENRKKNGILSMSQRRTAAAMTIAINNNNRCDATENCIKYFSARGRCDRLNKLLYILPLFDNICALIVSQTYCCRNSCVHKFTKKQQLQINCCRIIIQVKSNSLAAATCHFNNFISALLPPSCTPFSSTMHSIDSVFACKNHFYSPESEMLRAKTICLCNCM